MTFKTKFGEVRVRMITSYWASRLKIWVHNGQEVKKGERIGRIVLGSTTVLEVPGNISFSVKQGQHVTGGESIVYSSE
jgi:phosphatidylserine decarboxylase